MLNLFVMKFIILKFYCCCTFLIFRWSAPEVLFQPTTDEYHSDILCPATDMYSFGMMLWEIAAIHDPFEDIADEAEVRV